MNKQVRIILLFLLFILPAFQAVYGQAAFASEEELKQQAVKLFEEDEFEEAYPLYSQLVSLYPKDPNYNYRLGVCMLYASDDKEKALPFLEFSAKKPDVEKEAIFYLAKAYHLNYRFDDAIAQYQAYTKVASESKANKLQVERQIEMCRNGKKLLRNITDLFVIEKKDLSRADFYRAYDISDIGGKLLAKPDEESFRTPLDKKKKEKSIIYLATNNNQVYFSSFGDDLEHGKDIYIIRKLPNGEWSKPQTLGYPVNTEYDEDFPFLHPNGKVLYFCSKGHNSMGGYDIFKTTLNEETNTWNKPVNLDFPINTPDDDILYVTNEDEKEAYFSSARASKTGRTAVFHINVERKPIDVAIVKGMVVKNRDNQALDVKITVKDLGDNTILGMYNAKENGSYLINLPNGGRFMYTVEAAGFNTQSEIVLLPTQYEFKPLKQEISYETGSDKLIIKNLFDEPVDDQSYLLALNFIKEKSKLEAGVDAANANAAAKNNGSVGDDNGNQNIATEEKTTTVPKNNTGTGLSNDAIVKIAYDDAKEAEQEAKDLQEQADIALNLANQKNELAQNKAKEATQLMADANGMSDAVKKQTVVEEANQARTESEDLNQETVAAFNIAKKLQQKAAAKDEEADLSLQYAKALDAAVKSKNPVEALEKLKEQEQKLEALSEKNGVAEPDNIYSGLKMDFDVKKRELDKATQVSADIRQEIEDNNTLISTLQSDADKTKKDDLKQGLLDQIEGLKADTDQSKKDLEANDQKIAKLNKEYNGIQNEMALINSVVDKAKVSTNEAAAASIVSIDKSKLEQQVNEIRNSPDNTTLAVKSNDESTSKQDNVTVGSNDSRDSKTEKDAVENAVAGTSAEKVSDNSVNDNITDNSSAVSENATTAKKDKQFTDQLAVVENISDPSEKENKKAELLKEWTAWIDKDLADKRSDLRAEKNKDKKKELTAEISQLESQLKQKQEEERITLANIEKLNSAAIAANTGNNKADGADNAKTATDNKVETAAKTETNENDAASESANNSTNTTASLGSINTMYSDKLAEAVKTEDAAQRENKKAEVLKEWAAAIDANVEKQKRDLSASTDPEMKLLLEKKINESVALSKEKQDMALASESQAKALDIAASDAAKPGNPENAGKDVINTNETNAGNNDLAKNDNVSPESGNNASSDQNTGVNNTTSTEEFATGGSTPEKNLQNAIVGAERTEDEREKEQKKEEAYRAYIASLETEIKSKQEEVKTEKSKDKKKELNAEIAALQNDVKEKQTLADASLAKVKALDGEKAMAANKSSEGGTDPLKSTDNVSENSNAESDDASKTNAEIAANKNDTNSSPENDNVTTGNSSETANNTLKSQSAVSYTDPVAVSNYNSAVKINKEADDLLTRATDLKAEAAEKTSQAEKDALYVKAAQLSSQAEVKQIEAAQLISDANKSEFIGNRDLLEQLAAASVNDNSDQVAIAEMMKDESVIYFEKAQKSRMIGNSVSSESDKLAALQDATANETIALDKQKRATDIYKKANPGFVASASSPDKSSNVTNASTTDVAINKSSENSSNTSSEVPLSNSNDLVVNNDQGANKTLSNDQNKSSENPNLNNDVNKSSESIANNTKAAEEGNAAINSASDPKANANNAADNIAANSTETNVAKNDQNQSSTSNIKPETNAGNAADKTNTDVNKSSDIVANTPETNSVQPDNISENKSDNIATALTNNENAITENKPDLSTTGILVSKSKVVLESNEKFIRTDQPVYSATKPIPVNEALPEGLIYKVQIGAFRNPIDPEQFKGMSPITAETTSQGFTRYTAGLFTKYSTADQVKNEIRDLGYKDAFVVIFYNGKRISAAEAQSLSGENISPTASNEGTTNIIPAADNNPATITEQQIPSAAANKNTAADVNSSPAPAENIAMIGGLFYTVQVGVYSQPASASRLKNIQPLYSENTSNGNVRYNTGIYNNLPRAIEARNVVYNAGVKDAFVTAYYQGKRISLGEAKTLEIQGASIFATGENMNKLPVVGASANSPAGLSSPPVPANNQPIPSTEQTVPVNASSKETVPANNGLESVMAVNTVISDSGVVYKVQIGAFREEVPLEIADQFLKIAGKGIKNYKDVNGLTIYTLGSFRTYDEALSLKNEINNTVKDAFIVAYNNGSKISIEEAKKLEK